MPKEEIEKARFNARQQVLGDLVWLANQPQGRRILARFFKESRKKVFTGQSNTTFYAQGRMDLAVEVLDDVRQADLGLYQAAERESLTEERTHG